MFAYQEFTKAPPRYTIPEAQSFNEENALVMFAGVASFYQNMPPHNALPVPILPVVKLRFGESWEPQSEKTGDSAQINRNNDWGWFRQGLASRLVRNLYYIGHGSADRIGGDYGVTMGSSGAVATINHQSSVASTASLSFRDLVRLLRSSPIIDYRFAFIDGCESANGRLSEAFGIPRDELMTLTEYRNKYGSQKLRAFVSWKKSIVTFNPDTSAPGGIIQWITQNAQTGHQCFLATRAGFIANWASVNRPPLFDALKYGMMNGGWFINTDPAYLENRDNDPLDPGLLAVRGYRNLLMDEDNNY